MRALNFICLIKIICSSSKKLLKYLGSARLTDLLTVSASQRPRSLEGYGKS